PQGPRGSGSPPPRPSRTPTSTALCKRSVLQSGDVVTRQRIVLLGTGTGIGKTHVGVALVSALRDAGIEVAGLKPVESGIGEGVSDTERLRGASSFHVKHPPPYALAAPISPHLAADREGLTIHLAPIVRWVDSVEAACIVVETAGAVLSPLASG